MRRPYPGHQSSRPDALRGPRLLRSGPLTNPAHFCRPALNQDQAFHSWDRRRTVWLRRRRRLLPMQQLDPLRTSVIALRRRAHPCLGPEQLSKMYELVEQLRELLTRPEPGSNQVARAPRRYSRLRKTEMLSYVSPASVVRS